METSVNNKCKAFTSLEQSKVLAEILPLESADMCWQYQKDRWVGEPDYEEFPQFEHATDKRDIPCWSLAALLGVLPNNKHITTTLSRGGWKIEPVEYIDEWFCEYEDEDSPCKKFSMSADNPVDACVAMIEKLNELNLL